MKKMFFALLLTFWTFAKFNDVDAATLNPDVIGNIPYFSYIKDYLPGNEVARNVEEQIGPLDKGLLVSDSYQKNSWLYTLGKNTNSQFLDSSLKYYQYKNYNLMNNLANKQLFTSTYMNLRQALSEHREMYYSKLFFANNNREGVNSSINNYKRIPNNNIVIGYTLNTQNLNLDAVLAPQNDKIITLFLESVNEPIQILNEHLCNNTLAFQYSYQAFSGPPKLEVAIPNKQDVINGLNSNGPVPELSSMLLSLMGLGSVLLYLKRKNRNF